MNIKIHSQLFEILTLIHVKLVVLHLQLLGCFLEVVDCLDLSQNFLNLTDYHFLLHFQCRLPCLRFPCRFLLHLHHLIPHFLHVLLLLLLEEVVLHCFQWDNSLHHCFREYHLVLVHPFCLNFYFLSYINIIYYLFYSYFFVFLILIKFLKF